MTTQLRDNAPVWYACYGSNLSAERFACYIRGGVCRQNGRHYDGCRDKTMWTDSASACFSGEMYFGNHSRSWYGGGVAFFDPQGEGTSFMRLYRITFGQLRDVQQQEGMSDNWYGNLVYLGQRDGCPVYTFTSYRRRSANPPHASYLSLIRQALIEENGMDARQADTYLQPRLEKAEK